MTPRRDLHRRSSRLLPLLAGLGYCYASGISTIFAISTIALADSVRHNVLEDDTAVSLQTQRACAALSQYRGRLLCLSGTEDLQDGGGLQLDGILKANERGYGIVHSFLEKKVDRQFLDDVFRENNFQSASGLFRLRAYYRQHALDYTPHQFMGAFKLSNPSLPEVHLAGVKESTLRYSYTDILDLPVQWGSLAWTGSLAYFNHRSLFASVDLLSSTLQDLDEVMRLHRKTGIFGDLGISYAPAAPLVPQMGLSLRRIGFDEDCESCRHRYLDLEDQLYSKSYARAGYDFKLTYGRMYTGLLFPFLRTFQRYDSSATALAHIYEIGHFRSYTSFSPMQGSFGFSFTSTLYMIGVQYTDEKQNDAILLKREKHAYIHGSYFF